MSPVGFLPGRLDDVVSHSALGGMYGKDKRYTKSALVVGNKNNE